MEKRRTYSYYVYVCERGNIFQRKVLEKGYLFYQKRYIKGQQVYCGLDCHNKKPIVLTSTVSFFRF